MRKIECVITSVMVVVAGFLAYATYMKVVTARSASHSSNIVVMQVPSSVVIGNNPWIYGNSSAPFTIVEFGDYECPPCRAINCQVKSIVDNGKGDVRLVFHNLPLTKIHPLAMNAAIAAETPDNAATFWQVHNSLMGGLIDPMGVSQVLQTHGVKASKASLSRARLRIDSDLKLAESLNVNETPTIMLCCPDNEVLKVHDFQYLAGEISAQISKAKEKRGTISG